MGNLRRGLTCGKESRAREDPGAFSAWSLDSCRRVEGGACHHFPTPEFPMQAVPTTPLSGLAGWALPLLVTALLSLTPILPRWVPPSAGGHLAAQVPERERQEALAPTLGIVEISPELRNRLGLFPGVDGFRVARLLLREDGTAVLEVESGGAGRVVRERQLLDREGLEAFRARLASLLEAAGTPVVATREGRGGLVLGHTLLGLGYHGWAVPVALDIDSTQGAVAAYLLTAGASFYLPYRLTRDRTVGRAHRNLTLYGGTRGIASGLLLGDLVMSDDEPVNDSNRTQVRIGAGSVVGQAGALMGFLAAERWRPTEGTAALWGALGDAGLAGGAALALAVGPYSEAEEEVRDGDLIYMDTRLRSRRAGHALTLVGHGVGLAAGGWLGTRRDYSTGDATALRSATVLGAQVGATLARSFTDDEQVLAGSALAVGIGGIVAGDRLLGDRSLEGGAGLLVAAGHLAGGATALGVTYLITEEIEDRPVLYLTTSTLGSILGAGLVWRAVAPGRGAREAGAASPDDGPRLTLHPDGLLLGLLEWRGAGNPAGRVGAAGSRRDLPLLTVRF